MKYSDYKKTLDQDPEYQTAKAELKLKFDLGNAVLRARLKRGWSQTELARRVGTKQANISRIEAGLGNPTLELIQKVSKVLGLEIKFQELGNEKPKPDKTIMTTTSTEEVFTELSPAVYSLFKPYLETSNTWETALINNNEGEQL